MLSWGPPEDDLNSKSEWGQARVPKVTIMMPQQNIPGGNPNEDMNPEYRTYLAAVAAADRMEVKRK